MADRRDEPDISLNAVTHHDGHTYASATAGIVLRGGEPLHDLGSLCKLPAAGRRSGADRRQMGTVFDAVSVATLHEHRSPLNCGATFQRDGVPARVLGAIDRRGAWCSEWEPTARSWWDPLAARQLGEGRRLLGGTICKRHAPTGAAAFHRIDDFARGRPGSTGPMTHTLMAAPALPGRPVRQHLAD